MAKVSEEEPAIHPIDLSQTLGRLELGVRPVTKLCGISDKQLTYWTEQGFVQCGRKGRNYTYDYAAVEKAALIIQGLERGLSLRRAAKEAQAFLDRRARKQAELESMPIEELQARIVTRAYRLQELASRIRKDDPVARPMAAVHHPTPQPMAPAVESHLVSTEVAKLIVFFQSHPNTVFNAGQIASLLRRQTEEVAEDLETLAGRRFLSRIAYPAGNVYRYLSGR